MMWLKYTGVAPAVLPVQREFGPYVPVSIATGYSHLDPPLYWRLDNPKFNLVEIGIDRRTGQFVSLTVVFCKEVVHTLSTPDEAPPYGEVNGLPLFSLDPWAAAFAPDRDVDDRRAEFYDVPGRCRLEMGDEAVRVVLFSEELHHRVITREELVSEFNSSGQLCSFLLPRLSQRDRSMLAESLR
jgi:hypothetical protein